MMPSGQQERLVHALQLKDGMLADMYLGALRVLSDDTNPDRFALAAHELRELMEKIPQWLDFPIRREEGRKSLKERVRDLCVQWNSTLKRTACLHAPRSEPVYGEESGGRASTRDDGEEYGEYLAEAIWQGEVDEAMEKFLTEARIFFATFARDFQTRRNEAATVLRQLDRSELGIPLALEERNVDRWMHLLGYFTSVCHHGRTDRESLPTRLAELEELLLARLCPSTVADFDEIDGILAEAGDAD
jgi:hypothetical protein